MDVVWKLTTKFYHIYFINKIKDKLLFIRPKKKGCVVCVCVCETVPISIISRLDLSFLFGCEQKDTQHTHTNGGVAVLIDDCVVVRLMSLPTKRSGSAGAPSTPMKKAKPSVACSFDPSDDVVLDTSSIPMPLDDDLKPDLPNARGVMAANLSRKKATPPQPAKKLLIKLHKGTKVKNLTILFEGFSNCCSILPTSRSFPLSLSSYPIRRRSNCVFLSPICSPNCFFTHSTLKTTISFTELTG